MKKHTNEINIISASFFYILILICNISFIKCECTNGEPFKKSDNCILDCDINEIFQDKTCIPISTKEENINEMFDKIVQYYGNINVNTIEDKIIIEGENINYIITTNILENSESDSYLLNLGENCINSINEVTSDFFIVLINIINTDYITTSNGIKIFNNNNEKYLLSNLCEKQSFSVGIPIEVTNSEITLNKKIKNEYGYDIFNIDDPFYIDKCTKFTTPYNSDISLRKRNEIYGFYAKEVCSDLCTYIKFKEDENKIYCNCNLGGQKKTKNKIETESINIKVIKCFTKLGKDIKKNYMLFIMSILFFSFLLCFIITCIKLSGIITKYAQDFDPLKMKFLNYFPNELKKEMIIKKQSKKIEVEKAKEIKEEEDEDKNEDEEEEKSNESDGTNVNGIGGLEDVKNQTIQNNQDNHNQQNFQNNFNALNNQNFNNLLSAPNLALNPYIQYHQYLQYQQMQQYQQYQRYNQYMMNYMKNLNNNNNNRNYENEEEEEEEEGEDEEEGENEEKEEEEDDEEEDIKNGNEKKIKNNKNHFFPQFKDIDENAVYTLKLDYNKIKEYYKLKKKEKEKEEDKEIQNKNQENTNKKDKEKDENKLKVKKEESKLMNEKKKKKENTKDKKKEKKKNEDKTEKNDIKIFKKKESPKTNIENNLVDKQKKIIEKGGKTKKKNNKKSKNKEKGLNDLVKNNKGNEERKNNVDAIYKKNSTDNRNKINIKRKKKSSKTDKFDKLGLKSNLKGNNNKANPPKNSNISERELPQQKDEKESEQFDNEENDNEEEEEEDENNKEEGKEEEAGEGGDEEENKEEVGEGGDEEENKEEEEKDNDEEENKEEEKNEEGEKKEEKESNINEELNGNNNNEEIINVKGKEDEKEKKILALNLSSNEDNSTLSNIINNSENRNLDKKSGQEQDLNSNKNENKKIEIEFGSEEFYIMLNKIPEEKRNEFFNDSEINYLEYKYACDFDARSFFHIYSSMLKEENNIIYSLSYCSNDYNLNFVKVSFFIIQLILYITISSLFFADEKINNI